MIKNPETELSGILGNSFRGKTKGLDWYSKWHRYGEVVKSHYSKPTSRFNWSHFSYAENDHRVFTKREVPHSWSCEHSIHTWMSLRRTFPFYTFLRLGDCALLNSNSLRLSGVTYPLYFFNNKFEGLKFSNRLAASVLGMYLVFYTMGFPRS